MSDMDFDFGAEFAAFGDDLKGTSYEGEYEMRVKKATPGRTQKGKMRITVTLVFTSGPYAAKGKEIVDNHIWSPESDTAAKIFAQNLRILGAPQDWIMSTRPTPQQICDQITNNVVGVRLRPDEFNGQPTTRVSYLKSVQIKSLGSGQGGTVAGTGSATAAVSLDDATADEAPAQPVVPADVDETTGEVKEPAPVGAAEDPWAS
jgi:hypothetical protein